MSGDARRRRILRSLSAAPARVSSIDLPMSTVSEQMLWVLDAISIASGGMTWAELNQAAVASGRFEDVLDLDLEDVLQRATRALFDIEFIRVDRRTRRAGGESPYCVTERGAVWLTTRALSSYEDTLLDTMQEALDEARRLLRELRESKQHPHS